MTQGETFIRVRYAETDKMGIVYHSRYLDWMEVGRTEFFRQLGMPYSEIEKNNIFLPVIKVYCQYKSPAHYDDLLRIVTTITSLQEVRLVFHYEIFKGDRLLALGETEHAFVNALGKPVVLKKHNPFLWRRLLEVVSEHADNKG